MSSPSVSIAIASYNHERFIEQAICSVFDQTHRPLELIVIDDGSSDRSFELAQQLAVQSPIPMIVERQRNSGPAATFQRGLDLAKGQWFAILASDDFFDPRFVAHNLATAGDANDIVLHGNAHLVEVDGTLTGTMEAIASEQPLRGNCFEQAVEGKGYMLPSTMFLRRELLLRAGGFDPSMWAEDCDLQLRFARIARFQYVAEPLFYCRQTPGSLGKRPWMWGDSIIRALAKHEDVLGSRLLPLQSKASENISAACVENGAFGPALYWGRQALKFTPPGTRKFSVTGRLVRRSVRALARYTLLRAFGRERLVEWKRRLQRTMAKVA